MRSKRWILVAAASFLLLVFIAIINGKGKLVANLEGNEFSAQQLGDLVQQVLTPSIRKTAQ
jgi:hypothetical protein